MIREYCDKCKKEIPVSRDEPDPDDPGAKRKTEERFKVAVFGSTTPNGEYWEISTDVLCKDCIKNYCIEDPTAVPQ